MNSRWILAAATMGLLAASPIRAVQPTSEEMSRARDWSAARFGDQEKAPSADPPFSFVYDGKPSAGLLGTWKVERSSRKIDGARTERVAAFTDPATGLVATCRAVEYGDFPNVEWTLYFKNTGTADTPIISDILALDASFARPAGGEFILHSSKGDVCAADSYEPLKEALGPGAARRFAPGGGRPTNGQYPYWNIETPDGCLIVFLWCRVILLS